MSFGAQHFEIESRHQIDRQEIEARLCSLLGIWRSLEDNAFGTRAAAEHTITETMSELEQHIEEIN